MVEGNRMRLDTEDGGSSNVSAGYDSAILWSDDPEKEYFRSMMRQRRGAAGDDSLIGDSTIAGMMDDEDPSMMMMKAVTDAVVDSFDEEDNPSFLAGISTMRGDSQLHRDFENLTEPASATQNRTSGTKLAIPWFSHKNRQNNMRNTPPKSNVTSRMSSKKEQRSTTGGALPAEDEEEVPGFIFVTEKTSVINTPPGKFTEGNAANTQDFDDDKGPSSAQRKKWVCIIVTILILSIGSVAAIAVLAVWLTQGDSAPGDSSSMSSRVDSSAPIGDLTASPTTGFLAPAVSLQPKPEPSEAPSIVPPTPVPSLVATAPIAEGSASPAPSLGSPLVDTPEPTLSTSAPTQEQSIEPSMLPSARPTEGSDIEADLYILLIDASPSSFSDLEDPTSPQHQALKWLASDERYTLYSTDRIIQRWVAATLAFGFAFFPTQQRNLMVSLPIETDECEWLFFKCNGSQQITEVDIRDRPLSGTLPLELSLLSNNLERIVVPGCSLSGTVPTQFGLLTNLERIRLTNNDLTGQIPSELGNIVDMNVLSLERNDLSGPLPSELARITNLSELDVDGNQLSGRIPTEFGNFPRLLELGLSRNLFHGEIPAELGRLGNTIRIAEFGTTNLVGSVPESFCGSQTLDFLSADCFEVDCKCCTECCADRSGCREVTEAPSIAPSKSATSEPTLSPTSRAFVTDGPSLRTTDPPTFCNDSVSVVGGCYQTGADILAGFVNCDPRPDDWLGLYPAGTPLDGLQEPFQLPWVYSCGSQGCLGSVSAGEVVFTQVSLGDGSYQVYLARDGQVPYSAYAVSDAFEISQQC